MKKVIPPYFSALTIILFLSLGLTAPIKAGDPVLLLENGKSRIEANFSDWKEAPMVDTDEVVDGEYFRFMQFQALPDSKAKQEMRDLGVRFLDYLPQNTYYVGISENLNPSLLEGYNIRSVIRINPEDRVNLKLTERPLPEHCTNGEFVLLNLEYFKGVDPTVIVEELQGRGVEVRGHHKQTNKLRIRVDQARIMEMAELPFTYYLEPKPPKPTHDDRPGRTLHRSNVLNSQYPMGRHYDGTGVSVAIADDGGIGPHIDFTGRFTDYQSSLGGNHGDMTAGICVGAGNLDPTIQGMASGAYLHMHGISGYPHIVDAPTYLANDGVMITSTSYSQGCNEYTTDTRDGDQQIRQNPSLIHCFSAGNSASSDCGYGASGYGNITGGYKQGKNVIAVGNLDNEANLATSSSRGPAEDGRVKPDICANGAGQMSTDEGNTYRSGGGTSAAAPGIAGIMAQLYQAYRDLNGGNDPESPLIKASLLNTTRDLGNPGPDYEFGWGRVNSARAVRILEDGRYQVDSVGQGNQNTHAISVPSGIDQVRVMVYWLDYEGSPTASKALVNDLDMEMTTPGGSSYLPWILDPTPNTTNLSAPAVRGVDTLNNMEQVTLQNPSAGSYSITVDGTTVPFGPQKYYVVYEMLTDSVELTYPIGGEGFEPGTMEKLRWDAYGTSNTFMLEYSTDSGATWNNITSGIPSDQRFYDWGVPAGLSGDAFVRVTRNGISDINEAPFSIMDVPNNFQVEWACPDSIQLAWDSVPGAIGYEVFELGNKYMDSVGFSDTAHFVQTPYDPAQTHWYSVKAYGPSGAEGRRAIAISHTGSINCPIPDDAGVTDIFSPGEGTIPQCHDLSSLAVEVQVENMGTDSIPASSVDVNYQVNNGTVITETYNSMLASGNAVNYTFTPAADLSATGSYTLKAWTSYGADGNAYNDTTKATVEVISGSTASLPYQEDFESFALCGTNSDCEATSCTLGNGLVNELNLQTDDIDWRVNEGPTSSTGTGPSQDFDPGTSSGNYVYLEASGSCEEKLASLLTPCFDLSGTNQPEFFFQYHMSGFSMGELHVDVFSNGSWTNDVIPAISGNQGNSWQSANVDLTAFIGQKITIRFRGITGSGYTSDMALDAMNLYDAAAPPYVDFEANVTSSCSGFEVSFTDNSLNNPNGWLWSFSPSTVTYINGTNATSQNPDVQFNSGGPYSVKLVASNSNGVDSTEKVGYVVIDNNSLTSPWSEDMESFAACSTDFDCGATICALGNGINNLDNGADDDIDWRVNSGSTPSSNTGPTMDHDPGTSSGQYLYLEASNGCNLEEALLVTNCMDLSGISDPEFTFWYHMFGGDMGSLHVDVFNGSSWDIDVTSYVSGDQGDVWNEMVVDLNAYAGQLVKLRIRGITGSGFESDIALDDMALKDGSTSIQEKSIVSSSVNVYPNPNAGVFRLEGDDLGRGRNLNIFVMDISGRKVYHEEVMMTNGKVNESFDLSGLSRGVYYLRGKSADASFRKKLILD